MDTDQLEARIGQSRLISVSSDVLEIGRQIREGGGLWRGDETMSLCWNEAANQFEVWGLDAHREPYLACVSDTCDGRLLEKLAAGDWQTLDVFALMEAAGGVERARREAAEDDRLGELSDRLAWAVRRDVGHLHGGLNRGAWSVQGRGGA
jgi:hypothetical protein